MSESRVTSGPGFGILPTPGSPRPNERRAMRFGIFYEHQLPRPWAPDSEYRLLLDSLEQIELADRLGYDYAWEVEHHFLEEYSHSSAPEAASAALGRLFQYRHHRQRRTVGHGRARVPVRFPRGGPRLGQRVLLE